MNLSITPNHEKTILTLAAKIKGSHGGKQRALNQRKALKGRKTNGRRRVLAKAA